ncbi:hypothetical protein NM208_g5587 [Fusarium decemcellulare]|uniref:Uncharacterized protein n=1 Tax=Fusarium decemcellulare TaxID=57161 RepID=A0ACC1SGM9_9HYPO|nr:hypothetical protein NM208_g5587 [Fusarium decemcellulare]
MVVEVSALLSQGGSDLATNIRLSCSLRSGPLRSRVFAAHVGRLAGAPRMGCYGGIRPLFDTQSAKGSLAKLPQHASANPANLCHRRRILVVMMHIFGDIPMAILLVPVLRCWDRGALPPTSSVHRRPAGEHRSRLEWNHALLDIVMDDGIDGVCIEMMGHGIHVKAHVKAYLSDEC